MVAAVPLANENSSTSDDENQGAVYQLHLGSENGQLELKSWYQKM